MTQSGRLHLGARVNGGRRPERERGSAEGAVHSLCSSRPVLSVHTLDVLNCLLPWTADKSEERLAEFRALEAQATAAAPMLFADEVDIDLNPKIGRDWMLKGPERRVLTPRKNEKYYIARALDVRTGGIVATAKPQKNVGLFASLLWELVG